MSRRQEPETVPHDWGPRPQGIVIFIISQISTRSHGSELDSVHKMCQLVLELTLRKQPSFLASFREKDVSRAHEMPLTSDLPVRQIFSQSTLRFGDYLPNSWAWTDQQYGSTVPFTALSAYQVMLSGIWLGYRYDTNALSLVHRE